MVLIFIIIYTHKIFFICYFSSIEKIKSTGSTYMAASGLTRYTCDRLEFSHVNAMVDYALELFQKIVDVNEHSFNNFRMRIGLNIGTVVAGVREFCKII